MLPALALAALVGPSPGGPECAEPLSQPQVRLVEERVPAPGRRFRRRWRLEVENRDRYPAALFEAVATLAGCGTPPGRGRLRVEVHDERGEEVHVSCSPGGPGQLRRVLRLGALEPPRRGRRARPEHYVVRLVDRTCRRSAESAPVPLEPLRGASEGPEPLPGLPAGRLPEPRIAAWVERGPQTGPGGGPVRHWIEVENWWEFGPEWFEPAPDLEPCNDGPGMRTSFSLVGPDGAAVGSFCRFPGPETLAAFWFGPPRSGVAPESVRLVVRDRREGTERSSVAVTLR